MLPRVVLVLPRLVSCCTRVVSCCVVLLLVQFSRLDPCFQALSDKNEMCTLYYQNSTYNEIVYIPPAAHSFLPQYFVLIKIL